METAGNDLIQTIEWKAGMPVSTGTFTAKVLHCVADGSVTAHFSTGDETRAFEAGDDFSLALVSVTILTGSFDIN